MNDKILTWIKKTGYPLELFGESVLNELGFEIINSYMYKDIESEIFRELDLFSVLNKKKENVYLSINLLIECKKN
ncbi:hypothetical protein [Flavobacterium sp.]|uniref:hypothetical protein n=1 Tax=Flavobacterium sp. TaxID=239 RepID=UPI0037526F99